MFELNCNADVVNVARTFGIEALNYATAKNTISPQSISQITQCHKWANSTTIELDSFNDGNNEFCQYVTFTSEYVQGAKEFVTFVNDITIVRTGLGAFTMPAAEAVIAGKIGRNQMTDIIAVINARNEAKAVLGY